MTPLIHIHPHGLSYAVSVGAEDTSLPDGYTQLRVDVSAHGGGITVSLTRVDLEALRDRIDDVLRGGR